MLVVVTIAVVVYMQQDSPKCASLQEMPMLRRRGVEAWIVEVTSSARIRKMYGDKVPVLEVNG